MDSNQKNDLQIVEAAKKGNRAAFEEIVKRYERKVYNLAFRILGNQDDASDVLQDTFLQVFKNISTFKGDSKFSTWLYRIATNASLMKKRKDKKTQSISIETPILTGKGNKISRQLKDDWAGNPLDIVEKKEIKNVLKKAIASMHEEYRIPLVLRDIDGFSNEEVSKILNISVPAVKSRVHRARMFLREELGNYFNEEGKE